MSTVYNKVTVNNETILDLSGDTVASSDHIRSGYVGHLNDGTQVTGSYSGTGGATTIATGTYTGGNSQTASISVGKKMAQKDFIVILTAPNNTTVASNTTYKNVNTVIVCDSTLSNGFNLSSDGTGLKATGKYTFKISGSSTTFNTDGNMGGGYNIRNTSLNSNGIYQTATAIDRSSSGFVIKFRIGTSQYISSITYDYKIIYYGSNPSTDIVEVP